MTAVCAVAMLMGMTAFANEYPITHPFYAPDKGKWHSESRYTYEEAKYKSKEVKQLQEKTKTDTFQEIYRYALSEKWTAYFGYGDSKAKDVGGEFDGDKTKIKNWYVGFADRFIDDGKTFFCGAFDYGQVRGDDFDGQDKGYDLRLIYGKKLSWADPYVEVSYYNTLNRGRDNDPVVGVKLGAYKQLGRKFGTNIYLHYDQANGEAYDKFTGAGIDFSYSFTDNMALKLGYGVQLSDKQHDDDDWNWKTKSHDTFFASLIFSF